VAECAEAWQGPGCPEQVLIQSTGVIGQLIKKEKLLRALPWAVISFAVPHLCHGPVVAITTTDLVSSRVQ